MDIRSASITADILNYISDGKLHSMQEIANEVEVSRVTVQRHIQSLAYRYPIETLRGGINRGGVKLDKRFIVQGKILSYDKLQLINRALRLLQESNEEIKNKVLIESLIEDFSLPLNKEIKNENFIRKTS